MYLTFRYALTTVDAVAAPPAPSKTIILTFCLRGARICQTRGIGRIRMITSVIIAIEMSHIKSCAWLRQFGFFPAATLLYAGSQKAAIGVQMNALRPWTGR